MPIRIMKTNSTAQTPAMDECPSQPSYFYPSPKKCRLVERPLSLQMHTDRGGASAQASTPEAKRPSGSFPVLDSIAELIAHTIAPYHLYNVSEELEAEQVEQVAAAFRFSASGERVHLVIAGNGIVDEHVQFIHRIWHILRTIARFPRSDAGRIPDSVLEEYYPRIVQQVYTKCYDITYRHVFSQWGEGVLLHPDMKRPAALGNNSNMDKLAQIFICVEHCRNFFWRWNKIRANSPTDDENSENFVTDIDWKHFAIQMNQLTMLTNEVCSINKRLCESWASLCDHYSPPPIREAILNLTALHRAINVITSFAAYPFQKIFASDLDVILVPDLLVPTMMNRRRGPSNSNSAAITDSSTRKKRRGASVFFTVNVNNGSNSNSPGLIRVHTHPARALIEYLECDRIYASAPPALSYIGLSHPCCSECRKWISILLPTYLEFVNTAGGGNGTNNGSHVICGQYVTRK